MRIFDKNILHVLRERCLGIELYQVLIDKHSIVFIFETEKINNIISYMRVDLYFRGQKYVWTDNVEYTDAPFGVLVGAKIKDLELSENKMDFLMSNDSSFSLYTDISTNENLIINFPPQEGGFIGAEIF
jgi:hypothetical protein